MTPLPLAVFTNAQVRQIEQDIVEKANLSIDDLMSRAGIAAFDALKATWPDVNVITVLIGTGNNGGDGLVLARLAKEAGWQVRVLQVGHPDPEKQSLANKNAHVNWEKAGGKIDPFIPQKISEGVIVDALLGTGIKGELAKAYEEAIDWINSVDSPVLSIDVPSGLDSNTGMAAKTAVQADVTVVMLVLKCGLFTGNAADYIGELWFNDLDIASEHYAHVTPIAQRLVYEQAIRALPQRQPASHKGNHGHVCVIGGGACGLSGAPLLAGEAALRAGAGLVSAAVSPNALPGIARGPVELMCHPIETENALCDLLDKADVIVIGPGLGQSTWSETMLKAALTTQTSCVIDADALNLLSKQPTKRDNWILTPHPKEAARLLETTVEVIQSDRFEAVENLAKKYGGVVVLKGSGTIIRDENGQLWIAAQDLPLLGTAGTGDVLAGLIGGLLAQNKSLSLSALIGVSVHCEAATIERECGERGMLASDLFLHIRHLLDPVPH